MEYVNHLALFPLGKIVMTRGVHAAVTADELMTAMFRHALGDWGDVCDGDRRSNQEALAQHGRLVSVFHTLGDTEFWIITEHDRSCTTILLPQEY